MSVKSEIASTLLSILFNVISSDISNSKTGILERYSFLRFKKNTKKWVTDFCTKHDGTILTSGEFETYLTYQHPINKIFEYVLNSNIDGLGDAAFREQITEKTKEYLLNEHCSISVQDEVIIKELYEKIYWRLDEYCKKNLSLGERYKLATIINSQVKQTENILENINEVKERVCKNNINCLMSNNYKLPLNSYLFSGRINELKKIKEYIEDSRISILYGVKGIGKSQIAIKYAYNHKASYEYIYWITTSTKDELLGEYSIIAQNNNMNIIDNNLLLICKIKELFGSYKNVLVIYDGLNEMLISDIKEFLPIENADIIITTTNSNWDNNEFHTLEVDFMDEPEAVDLVLNNSNGRILTEADMQDIKYLVKILCYYPIALEYARSFIVTNKISIREYIKIFERYRLGLFDKECRDYKASAQKAWELSFDKINEKNVLAFKLYASCSFLSDMPFEKSIFSGYVENELEFYEILNILKSYSIISLQQNCVKLHSVTQEFMRDYLIRKNKYSYYWKECLSTLDSVLPKRINSSADKEIIVPLLPHLEAIFDYVPDLVDDSQIYKKVIHIVGSFYDISKFNIAFKIIENLLKMNERIDKYNNVVLLNIAAMALHYQGYTDKALEFIKRAIEKSTNISAPKSEDVFLLKSMIYGNKGIMLKDMMIRQDLNDKELTEEIFDNINISIEYSKKAKVNGQICNQYINLSNIKRHLSKIPEAVADLEEAEKYIDGIKQLEAKIYGSYGIIYKNQDKTDDAIEKFRKCFELSKEIGDKKTECTSLNHLSECYLKKKVYKKALQCGKDANKIALEINLIAAIIDSFHNLANYYKVAKEDSIREYEYLEKAKEYSVK